MAALTMEPKKTAACILDILMPSIVTLLSRCPVWSVYPSPSTRRCNAQTTHRASRLWKQFLPAGEADPVTSTCTLSIFVAFQVILREELHIYRLLQSKPALHDQVTLHTSKLRERRFLSFALHNKLGSTMCSHPLHSTCRATSK